MADPDEAPRRTSPAPLRLAVPSAARDAGDAASPRAGLAEPLARMLEALEPAALDPAGAGETLVQRLGDARTLALLAQGDTARAAGTLIADALRLTSAEVRRSLVERPEDAAGRLASLRGAGALRFGAVLVAQGLVAPRRLEAALEAQKESGRRIGEVLVAGGQIAAREVAEALWLQHKLVAAALALIAAQAAREDASPRLVHSKP